MANFQSHFFDTNHSTFIHDHSGKEKIKKKLDARNWTFTSVENSITFDYRVSVSKTERD